MKKKKGHWSVKNDLDFDLRAIDTTASDTNKDLIDYEVNPLRYFSDYDFQHNVTTNVQAPELKDGIDYQVVMARKSDAYPVTYIDPEFQDDNVNLEDTVISKEMLKDSEECLEIIKRYLSGEVSKLTAGFHLLLSKNSDAEKTEDFDKLAKAFVSENYADLKLSGSLPDNVELIESYLYNFPNHWLKDQRVFYVYRAAYADLDDNAKQELKDYGTITITRPDDKSACDLTKGTNGGYKVEIKTKSKSNATLKYQDGSFVFNEKVTLKPVFVSRKEIYNDVHLKTKPKIDDGNKGAKPTDVMVVLIGSVLNDIVIAIPDEIDLAKQNTASLDGSPVIPSWGYTAFYIALAAWLLTALIILGVWARKRGFFKNKYSRMLFAKRRSGVKYKRVRTKPEDITLRELEEAINDPAEIDRLLIIKCQGIKSEDEAPEDVKIFKQKHPEQVGRVDAVIAASVLITKDARINADNNRRERVTESKKILPKGQSVDNETVPLMVQDERIIQAEKTININIVSQKNNNYQEYTQLAEILKTLKELYINSDIINDMQTDLENIKKIMGQQTWDQDIDTISNPEKKVMEEYKKFLEFQTHLRAEVIKFKGKFTDVMQQTIQDIGDKEGANKKYEEGNVLIRAIINRCEELYRDVTREAIITQENFHE